MADEPENLTVRLLQEMRAEMRDMRTDLTSQMQDLREQVEDLSTRVDGNTLILNMVAGIVHNHEERITVLESRDGANS